MDNGKSRTDAIAEMDYAGWVRPQPSAALPDATILRAIQVLISAIVLLPCIAGIIYLLAYLLVGEDKMANVFTRLMH